MKTFQFRQIRFLAIVILISVPFLLQCSGGSNAGNETQGPSARNESPDTSSAIQPIAVWAYPDSNTVSGSIFIGVVAYHLAAVQSVQFSVDSGAKTTITEETVNPETTEYEYVFSLDTTTLADGEHTLQATVYPKGNGTAKKLDGIIVHVANHVLFNTWYVDCNAPDDSGEGTNASPWKTLGRALGTEWSTNNLTHAAGGDTVILRSDSCPYDLAESKYGDALQYITIKPDTGISPTVKGGVIRSPFMKFENINFEYQYQGVTIYSHHIWFKNCNYTGAGKIWMDTINSDEAVRSRNTNDTSSHDVVIENFQVSNANQGISMIGDGDYIVRDSAVTEQNGDAMKFQGNNILITGNEISRVGPPLAWSVSKKGGIYECSAACPLSFHISADKGASYTTNFDVDIAGSNLSATEVINQLNANSDFSHSGFSASVSQSPYPNAGNIKIDLNIYSENYYFYIDGSGFNTFLFSDNSINRNDLSLATPSKHSPDHCDYIANDARDSANVVIRNNRMYAGEGQGLKLDGIGNSQQVDFYKQNIAVVNNLFAANDKSARLIYMNYKGSGSPSAILHYFNILIFHNTIIKPATGYVRSQLTLDDNPYVSNMVIKNNIIGDYFTGDFPLEQENKGEMDYNLFTDATYSSGIAMNQHSVLGSPDFVSPLEPNWNYALNPASDAKGKADPIFGLKYDILWKNRDTSTPSIGAFE